MYQISYLIISQMKRPKLLHICKMVAIEKTILYTGVLYILRLCGSFILSRKKTPKVIKLQYFAKSYCRLA